MFCFCCESHHLSCLQVCLTEWNTAFIHRARVAGRWSGWVTSIHTRIQSSNPVRVTTQSNLTVCRLAPLQSLLSVHYVTSWPPWSFPWASAFTRAWEKTHIFPLALLWTICGGWIRRSQPATQPGMCAVILEGQTGGRKQSSESPLK